MVVSTSTSQWDLSPEPDLHPLYPSLTHVTSLLSSNSGLVPNQKAELVAHCLTRACSFGELIILQYLLSDPHAQPHVDLGMRDEDGLGLVSLAIHGFGADSDRDVEREECVRLLIAQGADLGADKGRSSSTLGHISNTNTHMSGRWLDTVASCCIAFTANSSVPSDDTRMFSVSGDASRLNCPRRRDSSFHITWSRRRCVTTRRIHEE